MSINIINSVTSDNKFVKPSFKAIYFKNDKVREKVLRNSLFPRFCELEGVQEAAKKYNIVISDVYGDSFICRACTDIEVKDKKFHLKKKRGTSISDKSKENKSFLNKIFSLKMGEFVENEPEIVAAGMKAPEVYPENRIIGLVLSTKEHWYADDKKQDTFLTKVLDLKPIFDKLVFRNEQVKEDFMNNPNILQFMSDTNIKNALNKYQVFINSTKTSPNYKYETLINYQGCTDFFVNKNEIKPAGLFTPEYTINGHFTGGIKNLVKELDLLNTLTNNDSHI